MTANLILQSLAVALEQRPEEPGPAWRTFEQRAGEVIVAGLAGRVDHVNAAAEGLPELYKAALAEQAPAAPAPAPVVKVEHSVAVGGAPALDEAPQHGTPLAQEPAAAPVVVAPPAPQPTDPPQPSSAAATPAKGGGKRERPRL